MSRSSALLARQLVAGFSALFMAASIGMVAVVPAQAAPITYTFNGSNSDGAITGTFDFDPSLCASGPCPGAYSNVSFTVAGWRAISSANVCDSPTNSCAGIPPPFSGPSLPTTSSGTVLATADDAGGQPFGFAITLNAPLGGDAPTVNLSNSGTWWEAGSALLLTGVLTGGPGPVPPPPPPPGTLKPNKVRDLKATGGPRAPRYVVSWVVPVNPGNRPVARYRILVNQVGFKYLMLRKPLPSSKTRYPLTRKFLLSKTAFPRGDVRAAVRYRVRVQAINAAGVSPISTTFIRLRL